MNKPTKQETKTKIALLVLLLSNIKEIKHEGGLCTTLMTLSNEDIITEEDRLLTYDYIWQNRPILDYTKFNYWWKKGKVKPRKKYLVKHINLLLESL